MADIPVTTSSFACPAPANGVITPFAEDVNVMNTSEALGASSPTLSTYIEDIVLAADTIQRIPIPAGYAGGYIICYFTDYVRVKPGVVGTAYSLPVATSTNGQGAALSPNGRRIPLVLADGTTPVTHIILRAQNACNGSIEFYKP